MVVPPLPLSLFSNRFFSSCEEITTEEATWNAFSVLGIPERFAIDEVELKQNYRQLMGEFHPDRYHNSTITDQEEMQEKSSAVTQAYQELIEPHTRAAHLMALLGKPMDETMSQQVVGMEFLMEIMEIREAVDNVKDGNDEELRILLKQNEERFDAESLELEDSLEKGDLDAALRHTARLQYWNRVIETIRGKMDE
jgi:molecular chaperone HscB